MTFTLADADLWRHLHRHCWQEGSFRSLDEAHFVRNVHSGHGPACAQYLTAWAYISRPVHKQNAALEAKTEVAG